MQSCRFLLGTWSCRSGCSDCGKRNPRLPPGRRRARAVVWWAHREGRFGIKFGSPGGLDRFSHSSSNLHREGTFANDGWRCDQLVQFLASSLPDQCIALERQQGKSDAAGPPFARFRDLRLRYVRVDVGEFLHGAHCGVSQPGRGDPWSEGPASLAGLVEGADWPHGRSRSTMACRPPPNRDNPALRAFGPPRDQEIRRAGPRQNRRTHPVGSSLPKYLSATRTTARSSLH